MASVRSIGYSGTPLAKKLGIQAGSQVFVAGAPKDYVQLLKPLPADVVFAGQISSVINVAHVFTTRRQELSRYLQSFRRVLNPEALIWVSWPKKAAKVATEVTEDTIRQIALPLGLVDVKVCAVTDVWSGLKLVLRKELR
jgi:hypothetical protein